MLYNYKKNDEKLKIEILCIYA